MRTVIFNPPLKHISGGLTAIWELADILARQGRSVAVCGPGTNATPQNLADIGVAYLPWDTDGSFLHPDDIWLIPEGWPSALAPGFKANAHILVYVQNWAFMVTPLPEGLTWKKLSGARPQKPLCFLAVSEPVHHFLTDFLNLDPKAILDKTLPPAIHDVFFRREIKQQNAPIRIAFMPRKNKALAEQTKFLTLALLEDTQTKIEFVSIHNLSREAVADLLTSCHIFLSTGFPEGFALPPVEAMACGCVPVGFTGLGGFEYMRNPDPHPLTGLYEPPFTLSDKAWGENGLFVADGDVLGAARALAHAVTLAHWNRKDWRVFVDNGHRAAMAYTRQSREKRVTDIWEKFEK